MIFGFGIVEFENHGFDFVLQNRMEVFGIVGFLIGDIGIVEL